MNDINYVGGKKASEILGVHQRTLYIWDKNGKIETIRSSGGKRFYNVSKYLKEKESIKKPIEPIKCMKVNDLERLDQKVKINYARVSSQGQKDDLERQKKYLMDEYPENILIEDIGSGINLTKGGLLKIIDLGIKGQVDELVIVHKDRLARFGYELIEYIITHYSGGKIIILDRKDKIEPDEEIVKDVLEIMNVFATEMNGRRKYKKNNVINI